MAFSTWLVHKPIEDYVMDVKQDFDVYWANFLAEADLGEDFTHKIWNVKTGKKVLEKWMNNPVLGEVEGVEKTYEIELPGARVLTSRADIVYKGFTVDIKMKSATKYADGWYAPSELLPFDSQLLGQAVAANKPSFCRWTVLVDKKRGYVSEPYIEEQQVDPLLRSQWLHEMGHITEQIERAMFAYRERGDTIQAPRNTDACHTWGRECDILSECILGVI